MQAKECAGVILPIEHVVDGFLSEVTDLAVRISKNIRGHRRALTTHSTVSPFRQSRP